MADLISVPFQNNTSYNIGTNERASNTLNIQPVIQVHLSERVLLISRIILPAYYNVRSDESTTLARWQARVQLAFLFPAGGSKPKPPEKEGGESGASALLTPVTPPPRAPHPAP